MLFGGFDGKYLGDVHHLYFLSGVGLVLAEKEEDKNSSVRRLNRYVVSEILPGTHAAENKIIKEGDYVMVIEDLAIHDGLELAEVNQRMWGKIGSQVSIRFLRYRGRAQPPEELGDHTFRRGKRLHHKDGIWTWVRPGIQINELTDMNWYNQSGVSGTVTCQPTPRFYHATAAIDNNVLVFGGFDGYDYQNDLYLLETHAEGDFNREWKWRCPSTSGAPPSRRSYAGLGVVGRKAVVTGGLHGRERFGDIYMLDCDDWTWTKLELHTMIPIAQHVVATYDSHQTQAKYDHLTQSDLQSMSMHELHELLKSKSTAASEHEPSNKAEVMSLLRCLLLRPGLLLHSGLQSPLEEGEMKGRRNDTWVLEIPYLASQQRGSPSRSPLESPLGSPGRSSPNRASPLGRSSPLGRTNSFSSFNRTKGQDTILADVIAVGRNVQGYLGLGLENQPSHPHDSGLGPARYAHDTHPTTGIRISLLSTNCFNYHPTTSGDFLEPNESVERLACGANHAVALCRDGRLFSWGQNENGQLGLGDNRQRQKPVEIYTFPAGSNFVKDVACGEAHTIATTSLDEIFTWGRNSHGELGLGHSQDRNSPQRVERLSFRVASHIAGGSHHSLVYVKSGGLFSFGGNDHGQLGLGNQIGSKLPVNVALLKETEIISIAAGVGHSAAVSSTGACYTWGGGIRGQLGHGRFESSWLATEVVLSGLGGKEALKVSCGDFFTGVLAREPSTYTVEAWLFGSNKNGELGFGAGGQDCASPVFVQHLTGKDLKDLQLGAAHCLLTCNDGMVYGWGRNRSGQLGLGHARDCWAPQQILIEEGGRTAPDNYPWLATASDQEISRAMRAGDPQVTTTIVAANDASFFICSMPASERPADVLEAPFARATLSARPPAPASGLQSPTSEHPKYLGEGEKVPQPPPGVRLAPYNPDTSKLDDGIVVVEPATI